jgi:hypothetical protein
MRAAEAPGEGLQLAFGRGQCGRISVDAHELGPRSRREETRGMATTPERAVDDDAPVNQRREEELDDSFGEHWSVSRIHSASIALAPQGFRHRRDHPHDAPDRRTGEREQ